MLNATLIVARQQHTTQCKSGAGVHRLSFQKFLVHRESRLCITKRCREASSPPILFDTELIARSRIELLQLLPGVTDMLVLALPPFPHGTLPLLVELQSEVACKRAEQGVGGIGLDW